MVLSNWARPNLSTRTHLPKTSPAPLASSFQRIGSSVLSVDSNAVNSDLLGVASGLTTVDSGCRGAVASDPLSGGSGGGGGGLLSNASALTPSTLIIVVESGSKSGGSDGSGGFGGTVPNLSNVPPFLYDNISVSTTLPRPVVSLRILPSDETHFSVALSAPSFFMESVFSIEI